MKTLVALSVLSVLALFSEIFRFKKFLFPIVLVGLVAVAGITLTEWNFENLYYKMIRMDKYAVGFSVLLMLITALWFVFSKDYFTPEKSITDYYALVLFALIGGVILVSYNNLSMLFLGIEILSIPVYVLAASKKDDISSNESGMKYFLMGAFASGFLLFGIAFLYGATGTFDTSAIGGYAAANVNGLSTFYVTGLSLVLVGLLFKVSAVPLHFWAPDVYDGAPTPVTAFMATVVKTAAIGAFMRIFATSFSYTPNEWTTILTIVAALTLLVGNITAVFQSNIKRMFAYSSISHAGYMLLAIIAMNTSSGKSILYYAASYSIASLIGFSVLSVVAEKKGVGHIGAFNGLSRTNPKLSAFMTLALLSMAGIPPLAGFFAKYQIFLAAFKSGHISIVLVAIVASLIGVYYYFRIIIAMYSKQTSETEPIEVSGTTKALLYICTILLIAMGLFPDAIVGKF
ncbi:MAG: NADH-quinone oxidoreductase subunit N [Bacteroidetes bacterium]|nr:NADH-quinone oxidoreductase subunit N [Bacteroidota bacterium]